jgi:hypothetical protein
MTPKRIPLSDHARLDGAEQTALEATIQGHRGLDDVFDWGRAQAPAVVPADVIVQDEYTHDVVVPWVRGLYLVYDTT